jgi:uncharacterized membrane protein
MGEGFTINKTRFEAFSDGVFAIAITLLVLEFHLPTFAGHPSAAEQASALLSIWPQYVVYAATFATVGIMWLNHNAQFRHIEKITHGMVIANLLLLLLIAFLPFPTEVLARFGISSVPVVYYGLTLIGISIAYNVVYWQILAAHPTIPRRPLAWSIVGLSAYPVATVVGFFVPYAGVALFALLAIFYMLPVNMASVALRPE